MTGSMQRQALGLGHIADGPFAARRVGEDAEGSSSPPVKYLAVPVVPVGVFAVILAILALTAATASAATTHPFKEILGSAAQPSFGDARGIAVDQSTGDVLVMDAGGAPSIERYNPDGTPDNFAALGGNVIDGQGAGDETPQGSLGFSSPSESQIAVDSSGGATDGNIYVTQNSPNLINIFSEAGEYLGQLSESTGGAFNEACGVAVDPSGAVYVGDYGSGIHKFVPAANPPANADNTATFSAVENPCTLAAGAGPTAGFIFAAKYNGPISKLDSATGEVKYEVSSDANTTLTVDPGSGHVFAATGSVVKEFDASGAGSATSISSFTIASDAQGVAVRGSSGEVYVSRSGGANVEVFGPLVTLPDVTTESPSSIGTTSATFNGTVNPDGIELSECFFEYGKTTSYGQSVSCAQSPASIGSGTSNVAVSADATGLEFGAEYHFRLVAKNANGAVKGADQAFKLESPPVVAEQWAQEVTFSEAVLKAKINPEGLPTTYRFEWGTTTAYGSSSPESGAGSDKAIRTVSTFLNGLQPGTTYHYRIVATNSVGTTEGEDLTFTTQEPFAPHTGCANHAFRYGSGAILPDCRAYEMVSPVDKNGGDIRGLEGAMGTAGSGYRRAEMNQASIAGDKVTFSSYKAFAGADAATYSNQYIARRGASGWSTEAISPPRSLVGAGHFTSELVPDVQFKGFTDDLSQAWFTEISKVPLTADALGESLPNLYGRDNTDGSLHALTTGEADNVFGIFPEISGHTADGGHVIFSFFGGLTPDAAPHNRAQLYDFTEGAPELISILPNGEANPDYSTAGSGNEGSWHGNMQLEHAISDDGSRIFWRSSPNFFGGISGSLYVRVDAETTVPVSEGEHATFWRADPEGSTAIYSEPPDGGTEESAEYQDLYEFDVDSETRSLIASEVRGVVGGSDDLSRLYFVSKEDLAAGATAGERNLYLDHEGTMTFIATLSATDTGESPSPVATPSIADWRPAERNSRVSADGRHFVFMSTRSLTGYDNTDAVTGEADYEVYMYSADAQQLTCVSCNPTGGRPVGHGLPAPYDVKEVTDFGGVELWTAAWLPTWENSLHASRLLAEDGSRVFFNSFDPLVSQDTNGKQDVYQWSAPGAGTCTVDGPGYSELNDGCVSLISTGRSSTVSEFIDASPSGDDVFFRTERSIDPRDPGLLDIYDARVGGGYPPPPPSPTPCLGDACQSVPAAPNDRTPASVGYRGAGNIPPRKARRSCRARSRQGKVGQKAKQKRAKRCKGSSRRAGR